MTPPRTTAAKLTRSDNRTIASRVGIGREQQLQRRNVVRHEHPSLAETCCISAKNGQFW